MFFWTVRPVLRGGGVDEGGKTLIHDWKITRPCTVLVMEGVFNQSLTGQTTRITIQFLTKPFLYCFPFCSVFRLDTVDAK